MYPIGAYIKGVFSSADASTAAVVPVFDADGNTLVLKAGQRIVIESFSIITSAAITITLFADSDDDGAVDEGEVIARGGFAANGGVAENSIEHPCNVLTAANIKAPKVKASGAGQVYVVFRGKIIGPQ